MQVREAHVPKRVLPKKVPKAIKIKQSKIKHKERFVKWNSKISEKFCRD